MDVKMIIAVSLSAVLVSVILVDSGTIEPTTTSTSNSTSTVTTNPSTSNSTALAGNPNVTTPSTAPTTTPSTTPKPISCAVGICDDDENCFGADGFGSKTTCQSGESCAVNETRFNGTYSMYSVSCASAADCETIQLARTGACCRTDSCTPELKTAARANANKHNGCDFPRPNMDVLICIIIISLKIM